MTIESMIENLSLQEKLTAMELIWRDPLRVHFRAGWSRDRTSQENRAPYRRQRSLPAMRNGGDGWL